MAVPSHPISPSRREDKPLFDPDEVRRAFTLLVSVGAVAEVRALEATTSSDRYASTWFGYFTEVDALVTALFQLRSAEGIYITLNPVAPALLARCANRLRKAGKKGVSVSDGDILCRRWLLIDCDVKRPSGISSTNEEHGLANLRARIMSEELSESGWPEPILADSANGAHLLYRIDLPAEDEQLVARCLAALQTHFGDDPKDREQADRGIPVVIDVTTANAARITKLYGTRGCKGDDMPERPHRLSQLLEVPQDLVPVSREQLEALIAKVTSPVTNVVSPVAPSQQPARPPSPKPKVAGAPAFDLGDWISRHGLSVTGPEDWSGRGGRGRRWIFATCPWNAEHSDGSAFVAQFDSGGIFAGCHHNGCAGRGWHDLRDVVEPGWHIQKAQQPGSVTRDEPSFSNDKTPWDTPASGVLSYVDALWESEKPAIYEPFPVGNLPVVVAQYVEEAAGSLDCDATYIIVPLLAALASAIGNTRRIRLKRDWSEPAVIWSAIVGESGTVKSPALELATQPVWRRARTILREYQLVRAEYEEEHRIWKAAKRQERGEEPERPPACEHPVVSDITIEALADRLLVTPRGTLVAIDELGAWFGSFNAYKAKGGDVSHWLALFGARPLKVDRKTGDRKTIYVPHAAVCVTGTIQPATLRRMLVPEFFDNGLAARILLAMPPTRVKQWSDREISAECAETMCGLFQSLYALRPVASRSGDDEPMQVDLTPGALSRWIGFVNAHNLAMADVQGDERAAFAKLEGYAARFALIIHIIRQITLEKTCDYLEADDIAAGIALAGWFGDETRRVYAVLSEDELSRQRRELVRLLRRHGGSATVRELARSSRLFRTALDWTAGLEDLIKLGVRRWQNPKPGAAGGRPLSIFHLLKPVDS